MGVVYQILNFFYFVKLFLIIIFNFLLLEIFSNPVSLVIILCCKNNGNIIYFYKDNFDMAKIGRANNEDLLG